MMTSKQQWLLEKLMKELENIDSEKYDAMWFMSETNYASNMYNTYATSRKEASEDISRLLEEKKIYENK